MCDNCTPAWNKQLLASKLEILNEFKGKKGHIIKTFLLNSEINFNGWMATKEANQKNAQDFRGMPMILFWNKERKVWDHPEYNSKDEAITKQEEFRVGTILEVGFDDRTGNWWLVAIIHNDSLWEKILSTEIKYVSPSVWPKQIVQGMSNPLITTDYWAIHVAFVSKPAFGIATGNVKGFCEGNSKKCLAELGPMVASMDNSIDHIRTVPFLNAKSSLIPNHNTIKSEMDDSEKKDFEKQISALKADKEELVKKLEQKSGMSETEKEKQQSGNSEDEKKDKTALAGMSEDDEEKQQSGMSETEEEKKEKQQSAAIIQLAKKPIIDKILTASKSQGATKQQLEEQSKALNAATIPELQKLETMFPTINQIIQTPQESVDFPSLSLSGSLDASVNDDVTDNDILEGI